GVFHTEEIVIKPMSSKLRHIPVFSGTTILGDGSVIMIIDPNGVAQALGRAAAAAARAENAELQSREEESDEDTVSLLVFRAGSQQPKAVPLSLVTRLEEIDWRKIEITAVGHFLPQAFEDWFRRRDPSAARQARSVLLVDDSAFFRDLLAPLIKAAGYRVG